jgi:hypothetical protein
VTRLTLAAAAAALAAGAGASSLGPGWRDDLTLRLWGGLARPGLYDARVAVHDENAAMRASNWEGGIPESDLARALSGGFEAGYGVTDDLRLTAALEGSGSSAEGAFDGVGPRTIVDPVLGLRRQRVDRLTRLAAFAQMGGASFRLRDLGWCRVNASLHAGAAQLAGSVERGAESGPFGESFWSRKLRGAAPAFRAALEWEWPRLSAGLPLGLFASIGWRHLEFRRVRFDYADSAGTRISGGYKNPDGTHRRFDFSGPDVRAGAAITVSLARED